MHSSPAENEHGRDSAGHRQGGVRPAHNRIAPPRFDGDYFCDNPCKGSTLFRRTPLARLRERGPPSPRNPIGRQARKGGLAAFRRDRIPPPPIKADCDTSRD
ncbi:MAG: hypothetical protein Kow0059_20170 [Candidatus Sumerlaeia bacterium]